MPMVDMKTGDEIEPSEPSPYGYGLRLCLNAKQCKALGITTPPKAGTPVNVRAAAIVARITEETDVGSGDKDNEVYMELQVVAMELGAANNQSAKLYEDKT